MTHDADGDAGYLQTGDGWGDPDGSEGGSLKYREGFGEGPGQLEDGFFLPHRVRGDGP